VLKINCQRPLFSVFKGKEVTKYFYDFVQKAFFDNSIIAKMTNKKSLTVFVFKYTGS